MAVQFNLLPSVKLAFVKAERQKRIVTTVAVFATVISLALLVFSVLVIRVFQQNRMNALGQEVESVTKQIQATKDINKILTVQNQVHALEALHNNKPVATRLFPYLTQIIPNNASIATLDIDYEASTLKITGEVADLATVQKFADALKLTTYTVIDMSIDKTAQKTAQKTADKTPDKTTDTAETRAPAAFANVVLSTMTRSKDKAGYSIELGFDPVLFQQDKSVTLVVPLIDNTTGPDVTRPTPLFQPKPVEAQ